MHVLTFLAELKNAEISPVTLIKSDCTTYDSIEVIVPVIFKALGTLEGNICSRVSLQHSCRWVDWTALTSR